MQSESLSPRHQVCCGSIVSDEAENFVDTFCRERRNDKDIGY